MSPLIIQRGLPNGECQNRSFINPAWGSLVISSRCFGHRFTVIQSHAPDLETLEELRRIGVNLNQIAKALNAGREDLPASLVLACDKLDALLERWLLNDNSHHNRPQL